MKNNKKHNFTKIVATLGPATESESVIKKLIKAGMNVARFNTKHSSPEWHLEVINRVKKLSKEMDVPVSILVDLQGPEIRIDLPNQERIDAKEGMVVTFTSNQKSKRETLIYIPQNVIDNLSKDDLVSIDDGACRFKVVKKGKDYLNAVVLNSHVIKHRKTLNTPGIEMHMPSLIDLDFAMLDQLEDRDVDYIALSLVRNKKDIQILKKEIKKRGIKVGIIAKIENQAGLDNLDEIIENADGIMIARGDLAVEVPFEQLTFWQKVMIDKCRAQGKPVIIATQMLETMIENPMPTRAEVSDIAHAIYDKTDAVMLSGETTIGKYPVKCVEIQAKIANFNEQYSSVDLIDFIDEDKESVDIMDAAVYMLAKDNSNIDSVIILTESGKTAAGIVRARPRVPVHVVTTSKRTYFKMPMFYGAIPHLIDLKVKEIKNAHDIIRRLKNQDWISKLQRILVIHGKNYKKSGNTDSITIIDF